MAEGGTVDKFMGDSIMAFWNAPLEQPDHVDRALRAAFAMRRAQTVLNQGFAARGMPPVDFGVGLNTGTCSVGLMGSRRRLEYSCVGDTVNVASRLESLTKEYGVWNVVSEAVLSHATAGWHSVLLDEARVKGRNEAVRIHAVLGPADRPLSPELASFAEAVTAARSAIAIGADPSAALAALRQCRADGIEGATLASLLANRVQAHAAE
jgi:adenylate cyclase